MRQFLLFIAFTLILGTVYSQDNEKINTIHDQDGNLRFETLYEYKNNEVNQILNWFSSFPNEVNGEINRLNSKSGEAIYSAKLPVSLSEKTSVYKTEMHFKIHIYKRSNKSVIELKDIYYTSIPEYGKQGTPSLTSYPVDWFSTAKLYKKSGEIRWLNQKLKQNTIAKAIKLLSSSKEYF